MKTNLKSVFITGALLFASLQAPGVAESQVFHSIRSLLTAQFSSSERVSFERVAPTGQARARIEQRLGRPLPEPEYTFYVARSGDVIDGYALFDRERGQHEMIDLATFFDAEGRVTRVEVMAYREPYGDGVRSERFRRQFVGRDHAAEFRPGHEIDIVSGATISSHSMSRAVQRATLVLHETLLSDGRLAHR